MSTYACYRLLIASDLVLPELEAAPTSPGSVDVVIAAGAVGSPSTEAVEVLPDLWCHGSTTWFDVAGIARFEARDGRFVTYERAEGARDGDVRLFLLGTVLGAIMWQRDHLVLHGNAFRVGQAAAVVVGHSGAGKSTLAGELAGRGIDLLSDDVVPIDESGMALPGYPRIKLWADALSTLGRSADDYERITESHAKYHVPVSRGELPPLPARWIYVLDTHDGPSIDLVEISGAACFDVLSAHTYRRELAADPAGRWRHLQQCAALAGQARVVRVRRPVATMTAHATAEAILADVARHTPSAGRRQVVAS